MKVRELSLSCYLISCKRKTIGFMPFSKVLVPDGLFGFYGVSTFVGYLMSNPFS